MAESAASSNALGCDPVFAAKTCGRFGLNGILYVAWFLEGVASTLVLVASPGAGSDGIVNASKYTNLLHATTKALLVFRCPKPKVNRR